MFTGIVEELGEVLDLVKHDDYAVITVGCPTIAQSVQGGDSVAVNGVCLTATDRNSKGFSADVMGETLQRTALGDLSVGDVVNLERPVQAGGRLGGHVVQGHVDGVATIGQRIPQDNWELLRFSLPAELARYVVAKGSIAIDGTSLTVIEANRDEFTVGLIPTTLARTSLGRKGIGARVNIEVDILAKYVERLLPAGPGQHEEPA